jgi:hypothetical protein
VRERTTSAGGPLRGCASLPRLAAAAILVWAALSASGACAALVLFEDGRHLHVKDFEVQEDQVSLRFDGGGSITIPLDRVSRIVDDEIDHTPPVVPALAEIPSRPLRSMRTTERPAKLGPTPFDELILAAAREHKVDPALIAAIMRAESNFAPRAVSRKGARGLMQLMPATARSLGVQRIFDPAENIRGGARYLSQLAERYGDTSVELIAAAYNAGEGAVKSYNGIPPYRETREYVRRVTRFWNAAYDEPETASVSGNESGGKPAG